MRTGLSTIQQTLMPEAASVLNQSIAEAGRRNHGQTTPLHVAATLLAAPTGFLRQACIRSHPNSSHPLQCRALELCFSVALERLPTAQNMAPGMEPEISNALMAALKRAQAHQRRGCPEQQQQPLLAVKVELEQLIISILDDPSVSRVMREASFSSPAVKATIEQLQNSNSNANSHNHHVAGANVNLGRAFGGITPRMLSSPGQLSTLSMPKASPVVSLSNRNIYLNPRLQQGGTGHIVNRRSEEVKKVIDILVRADKRNPVLVGDSGPEAVVKELLRNLENKELGIEGRLINVQAISIEKYFLSDKNQIPMKIKELGGVIGSRIKSGGIILDLGDLKWLVEQPVGLGSVQPQQVVTEMGRSAVFEMAKLLARFGGDGSNGDHKLWLIGTATCETYMRCQVYHTTMENDWDLQAVPIASRSPLPGMFPRFGTEGILSTPTESLSSLKSVKIRQPVLTHRLSGNLDTARRKIFCPRCSENYEKEVAKLVSIEKSFSEAKPEATRPSLPQWLQNAKLDSRDAIDAIAIDDTQGKDQGMLSKKKTQDLQKKWRDTCLNLHPDFHRNICSERTALEAVTLPLLSLENPSLLAHQSFQPKLQTSKPLGESLQLNTNQVTSRLAGSPPGSPVRTDLVLGCKGTECTPKRSTEDYISSETQTKFLDKFASALDSDSYKELLKGLMAKAWWQAEASSAVASAITHCRLGNGKQRGAGSRSDIWLLFTGPDRVAKKKMASVLAEQICGTNQSNPILTCLSSRRDDENSAVNFRGKTAIDRIAEAVRRNPFSVIMLEDIDEADILVRGSIKQAMDRGRLTDTHGRDVSLGNAIFILTGDWSTTNPKDGHFVDEKKLASLASGNCQLELIVKEKSAKRQGNWFLDEDRPTKPRIEVGYGPSLDLNLAAHNEDETDTSHNSSVLTIDHEDVLGLENVHFSISSVPHELASNVDDSIPFKPVDLAFVLREIKKTILVKFSMVVDDNFPINVEDDVVEKILGGLWHDRTSLQEWIENVLVPGFEQLKMLLPSVGGGNKVVWLVIDSEPGSRGNGGWLPSRVTVKG